MKKIVSFLLVLATMLSVSMAVLAEDANVTYDGNAQDFIFEPGSEYSPTDLFPNFKGVMPGDKLIQKITVKNDASDKVDVKIYLRALGAQAGSEEFLKQLKLTVMANGDTGLFEAPVNETAQLTDWVCLGTFKSGSKVDLDVTLEVPIEMGNEFQDAIGYLDWEFKVEETPIPEPTPTGDAGNPLMYTALLAVCTIALGALIAVSRKRRENV